MLAEFGLFALLLALCFSVLVSVLPIYGYVINSNRLMRSAVPFTWAVFFFLLVSFSILVNGFMTDDFSILLVSNNSNSALPWYYKFSATWGNHEGSMLLWILMLSMWSVAVTLFARTLTLDIKSTVLAVLGMITLSFITFIVFTSNPFERILPVPPMDGRDLNPLLQDIGLILHPPDRKSVV